MWYENEMSSRKRDWWTGNLPAIYLRCISWAGPSFEKKLVGNIPVVRWLLLRSLWSNSYFVVLAASWSRAGLHHSPESALKAELVFLSKPNPREIVPLNRNIIMHSFLLSDAENIIAFQKWCAFSVSIASAATSETDFAHPSAWNWLWSSHVTIQRPICQMFTSNRVEWIRRTKCEWFNVPASHVKMLRLVRNVIARRGVCPSYTRAEVSQRLLRWTSSDVKPYRVAILEEFNEKLSVETIRNRAKLGDGMVTAWRWRIFGTN